MFTHGGPEENVEEARGDRDLGEVAERAGLAEADEGGERPVEAVQFAHEDVRRLRALKRRWRKMSIISLHRRWRERRHESSPAEAEKYLLHIQYKIHFHYWRIDCQ